MTVGLGSDNNTKSIREWELDKTRVGSDTTCVRHQLELIDSKQETKDSASTLLLHVYY